MSEVEDVARLCRRDIVASLIKIASETGRPYRLRELWRVVEARENLLRLVATDYDAELEQIDRDLEAVCRPSSLPPVHG